MAHKYGLDPCTERLVEWWQAGPPGDGGWGKHKPWLVQRMLWSYLKDVRTRARYTPRTNIEIDWCQHKPTFDLMLIDYIDGLGEEEAELVKRVLAGERPLDLVDRHPHVWRVLKWLVE